MKILSTGTKTVPKKRKESITMDILRDVQRAFEQETECGKSFAELIVELAFESKDPMELSLQLASDECQTINH